MTRIGVAVAVTCLLVLAGCAADGQRPAGTAAGGSSTSELATFYHNRGLAMATAQDYDRAIADFGEALRIDPSYSPAYNDRGVAYRRKGDFDRAIQDYNEALRLNPKYGLALTNRGIA